MFGGNDLDSHPSDLDLRSVVESFVRFANRLHGNGIKVVVLEVYFRGSCRYITPEHYQKLRSSVSKRLRNALKKYSIPDVHYPGFNRSCFRTDLIHLNHGGYKRIPRTLNNFI